MQWLQRLFCRVHWTGYRRFRLYKHPIVRGYKPRFNPAPGLRQPVFVPTQRSNPQYNECIENEDPCQLLRHFRCGHLKYIAVDRKHVIVKTAGKEEETATQIIIAEKVPSPEEDDRSCPQYQDFPHFRFPCSSPYYALRTYTPQRKPFVKVNGSG